MLYLSEFYTNNKDIYHQGDHLLWPASDEDVHVSIMIHTHILSDYMGCDSGINIDRIFVSLNAHKEQIEIEARRIYKTGMQKIVLRKIGVS